MWRRLGRVLTAGLALAAAGGTTTAAARTDPYAPPGTLPALSAATLDARFAATRASIRAALGTAARVGDLGRVRNLSALLAPGRTFLSFDARGGGQAVEVIGELPHAERIAVVVPGADGNLENYDSWKFAGGGARALHDEAGHLSPQVRLAVVAWLGYDSPSTLSPDVLTDGRAKRAAVELRRLVAGLRRTRPAAPISLLCHSYGTVVCGKAAAGLPISELAFYGSPGTTFPSAKALHTSATVWAGRKSGDWVGHVPNVRLLGLVGFGADPTSKAFGARDFEAGPGTHSGYFKPGSRSLRDLALIALGREAEVPRA